MTALHVTYRPKTFDEVIGQPTVVKSLKNVVKDGRAHTFLLTGPSGTGKTTLARILSNSFAGGKGTIANIQEVDAASRSGADDMRGIISRMLHRAVGKSPVKSIIIDEAHRLSGAAWTVLLKATEEPPEHVYFMFCTTDGGKIPKTMKTRCLAYDLKPVSPDAILKLLTRIADDEKLDVTDEVLEAVAEGADGSPRQALVHLEACLYCESAAEARQAMRSAGQTREVIDLCRWLISGRGQTWREAVKYVKGLEGTDAESVRIVIVNYLSSVLLGTTEDKKAAALLTVMDCFKTPYAASDKMGPLLYSLGIALNLDR